MTTATDTTVMTPALIKQLKNADSVAFFHTSNHNRTGLVRVFKDTVTIDIPVDSVINGRRGVYAHTSIQSARFHEQWTSIVSLLKAGDRIALIWDHNNWRPGNETERNLDNMNFQILRSKQVKGREILSKLTFFLDFSMSRINDDVNNMIKDHRNHYDGP
jgi:hypothetical protein